MAARSAADLKRFLEDNHVPLVLTLMVESICLTQPKDCVGHMIQWLKDYQAKPNPRPQGRAPHINFAPAPAAGEPGSADDFGESSAGLGEVAGVPVSRMSDAHRRRLSGLDRKRGLLGDASGAGVNGRRQLTPRARARLERCLMSNILFRTLGDDALDVVYSAMTERTAEPGTFIVSQYDEGDFFYIIESGTCHILIQPAPEAEPVYKSTIGPGASFGELALLYGTPRAASVQAVTHVRLWSLDRDTFRRVLLTQTLRKRRQYEDFLAQVPLFEPLTPYERLTMADALQPCTFQDQEVVVREGADGGAFYIIIDGRMRVTQTINGRVHAINVLGSKDFFGEMSLMYNQPCVATVTSEGTSHCVCLDRDSFTSLLGPIEDILQRNMQSYVAKRDLPE